MCDLLVIYAIFYVLQSYTVLPANNSDGLAMIKNHQPKLENRLKMFFAAENEWLLLN